MKQLFSSIVIGFILTISTAQADDRGTKEEAKAMVQKAIAYMKANGLEKTVEEVNNRNGQFVDRDLYVTIYDMNMKNLAHGANARMVGKDMIDLKDVDGKAYMRERQKLATSQGSAWQDFKFVNPVTKKIEPKTMYIEKSGNVIFGCGFYR
jgi:cytochrome c